MEGLLVLIVTVVLFAFLFWYSGRKYNQEIAVGRAEYQTKFTSHWGNDHYGHHNS